MNRRPKLLAAAIGDCVHVAGIAKFCHLAEEVGYGTVFLGPAVDPEDVVRKIVEERPDIVGVSYRLTPEAGERVVRRFIELVKARGLESLRYWFGGTPPVAERVRSLGFFEAVFDGREGDHAVIARLRGRAGDEEAAVYPDRLVDRIAQQYPYPLIRHHYGEPSFEKTLEGVRQLAERKVLDVISLGVDQNTQEHFFRPDEMDPLQHGAGGVPVRTPEQFRQLYLASRRGNHPLMRSYSGTRDMLKMAEVLIETIRLAWGAIPLTWYSRLDGRSQVPLAEHIREAQETMRFLAAHDVPVEMNESHHWSLRDAPDSVAVAMAFLAAYNPKACGVRHYVAQYMFNTPPGTSFKMDLAKMLAKIELIEGLQDETFTVFRETRTGLSSLPADLDLAKGHLASSVFLQMALRPHIVHVVAHVEADHAATPEDVEEAVKIARGAIKNALYGQPDMLRDPEVQARKEELVEEARLLLNAIREIAEPGVADPWSDPATIAKAVNVGLIDAAHLRNNPEARGEVRVKIVGGACRAVDPDTGRVLSEAERVRRILDRVRTGRAWASAV
ncbi:MAG: cobalamin B12-binding domain-containing protein [Clostridia bacterium]|nr:cobalamin B12-binding domain-containing protein [Clostridia bacterium]